MVAGMVLGTVLPTVLANPGYTPIEIRVPKEGKEINKNAALTIVTERLDDVFGIGPAEITVAIRTIGPRGELVASGSVRVFLVEK